MSGHSRNWVRTSDEGEPRTYSFCPECGATVFYVASSEPSVIAIPVGAFADPAFPPPQRSVWESRKHQWVTLPASVEHLDTAVYAGVPPPTPPSRSPGGVLGDDPPAP